MTTILDAHRANRDFLSNRIFYWARAVFAAFKASADTEKTTVVSVRINELIQEILVNPLDQSPLREPVLERDWVWERSVHENCRTQFSKSPLDEGNIMTQPPSHLLAIKMLAWAKKIINAAPKIAATAVESKAAPKTATRVAEKRPNVYKNLCHAAVLQRRSVVKIGDTIRGSLLTSRLEQIPLLLNALIQQVVAQNGQIYIKNFWSNPEPVSKGYVGVHAKIRMPIPTEITKKTGDRSQTDLIAAPKKYILMEVQIHIREIMDGTEVCAKEIAHRIYKEPEEEGKTSPDVISSTQLIYLTAMKKLLRAQQDSGVKAAVLPLAKQVTQADKSNRLYAEIGLLLANEKLGCGAWSDELQAVVPEDKAAVAAMWVATAKKINKMLNLPIREVDENSYTNTATSVEELYENAGQMAPHFEKMCREVAASQPGCSVNFGPGDRCMIKERQSLQDKITKTSHSQRTPKTQQEKDIERGKFMTELSAKTGKSLSEISENSLSLTALQSLNLSNSTITDNELARLRDFFPELQGLDLSGCQAITDSGLTSLESLSMLQHLSLYGCNITDRGLFSVGRLTALQSLNLGTCQNITDNGLTGLGLLNALQCLNLGCCYQITDLGVANLEGLSKLQTLCLSECEEITDRGVASVGRLTALQQLILSHCNKITNSGLASLEGLAALQLLYLAGCDKITDTGFASLEGFTALECLDVSYSGITDCGFFSIGRLTALQHLILRRVNLTDIGLANLGGLTALQSLDIGANFNITDIGLASLGGLTALQSLGLTNCTGITKAAKDRLRIRIKED